MLRGWSAYVPAIAILSVVLLTGCPNPANDPDDPDARTELFGTWVEDVSPFTLAKIFVASNAHVLFQAPNLPISDIATHGNFRFVSYDGTTVTILDYDLEEVTFTATVEDGKLTLSGLNAIKIFPEPFERRNYNQWNSDYLPEE